MRPVVVAAVLTGAALAWAEGETLDLRRPERWEPGEVVSARVTEATDTRLTIGDREEGVTRELSTELDASFTLRCVEAGDDGRLRRSVVRVDTWSMLGSSGDDRSLEGAVVDVDPKGWKLRTARGNLSRAARGWLDNRFGPRGRGFSGGLAEIAPENAVGAGASWTGPAPALAAAMGRGMLPFSLPERPWKFTLTETTEGDAGRAAAVACEERFDVEGAGETRLGDLRIEKGSTVLVRSALSGVPGLWRRTGRMETVSEDDLRTSSPQGAIRFEIRSTETEEWQAGGDAADLPAEAGALVSLQGAERWAVGAWCVETGSEDVVAVATPLSGAGEAGEPERVAGRITWVAEAECKQTSGGFPVAAEVRFAEWRAVHGDDVDESLRGARVRCDANGVRIVEATARATDAARGWLESRLGALVRGDDALRAAMTPAMPVAVDSVWRGETATVRAAVQSRFPFPLEQGSLESKGTLVRVEGGPDDPVATIRYEVRSGLSCAPGCSGAVGDVMKGSLRIDGTAAGPAGAWSRLGSLDDAASVSVTLPGRTEEEEFHRLALDVKRRVARTPLAANAAEARAFAAAALAKLDAKDAAGAAADLTRALEADPTYAPAWTARGRARRSLGEESGAAEDFAQAIAADPRSEAPRVQRAILRRESGDLAGALEDLDAATRLQPRNRFAWYQRGLVHAARDDARSAAEDFGRAIDLDDRFGAAHRQRGLQHVALGDEVAALADFTRAIEIDASDALALSLRAETRADGGDFEGAVSDHLAAIAASPGRARAHFALARARFAPGLPTAPVLESLRKTVEIDPEDDYAQLWLCLVRTRAGDAAAACDDLRRRTAARKRPTDDWYLVLAGLLAGDLPEEKALEAAARAEGRRRRERTCEAAFYAAMLRVGRGETSEALALLDRALAADVRSFIEHSAAARWRTGLLFGAVTSPAPEDSAPGAVVLLAPDARGPAGRSGLAEGDVLHSIDGAPLARGGFRALLAEAKPGAVLRLGVRRGVEEMAKELRLGDWER